MKDFNAVGKVVDGNEGDKCNYPMRLDTYGCGCQHDCKYCYAKSLLDFRKLWNPKQPSVAPISKISREIRKIPKGTVVRLGVKFLNEIARHYHELSYEFSIVTSAKNMIAALRKSSNWVMIRYSVSKCSTKKNAIDYKRKSVRSNCKTASFMYKGE